MRSQRVIHEVLQFGAVAVLITLSPGTMSAVKFNSPLLLPTGNFPLALAVADFNGDGKQDVVVLGELMSVFLGNGDSTFRPPVTTSVFGTNSITSFAVADF